jgi:hypothetical protein
VNNGTKELPPSKKAFQEPLLTKRTRAQVSTGRIEETTSALAEEVKMELAVRPNAKKMLSPLKRSKSSDNSKEVVVK